MNFLVDESLPPELAVALRAVGHDARHVYDYGLQGHPDEDVYDEAVTVDRIVITRDLDFSDIRFYLGPSGIALVRDRHNLKGPALLKTTLQLVEEHLDDFASLGSNLIILEAGRRGRVRPKF